MNAWTDVNMDVSALANFEGSSGHVVMLPDFRQNLECCDLYAKLEIYDNMPHKSVAI